MKNWKVKIFIILFLIPGFASAQVGSRNVPVDNEYFQYIGSTDDMGIGSIIGGIFGDKGKAIVDAAKKATEAIDKIKATQCIVGKALQALNVAEKIDQWSFGGLKLLTGPIGESAMIKGKIEALDGAKACVETQLKAAKDLKPANLMQGQLKQQLIDELTKQKNTIDLRLDELNVQYRIAQRGFWKGIMIATLLKTTKTVTQRLVNSLTSRYKINDVMQYADAVASNVYTAQLIHDRAADNEEQMIFRSIITNPLLRTKVDNVIYQRAADALQLNGDVFSARSMSADDPDFYLKMAKFGNAETSVPFLKTAYENRAAEIQSAGLSSAQNEILLGSGLKAPRSCAGNVNEQKSIEMRWNQAQNKLADRQALYNDLYEAYNTQFAQLSAKERTRLLNDLDKAEADYLKAAQELKAMPTTFKSTNYDGQKKGFWFKTCEAIASPAESVNKGIDKAFDKYAKSMADYNDNNLPFFMSWIGDIGSNIASNLIFGGDLKATLLAESGNVSQAINVGLSFADSQAAKKNLENGVSFSYNKGNSIDEFILDWEILDVNNASFITINGSGISDVRRDSSGRVITDPQTKLPVMNRLPLNGSTAIKTKTGGQYILRVYDKPGRLLTNQGSINISVSAPGSVCGGNYGSYLDCVNDVGDEVYCKSICGTVSGAFIQRPSESLRGQRTEGLR